MATVLGHSRGWHLGAKPVATVTRRLTLLSRVRIVAAERKGCVGDELTGAMFPIALCEDSMSVAAVASKHICGSRLLVAAVRMPDAFDLVRCEVRL